MLVSERLQLDARPFDLAYEVDSATERGGQVVAFVKSLKFQRSTSYQHGRDLLQLVEEYAPLFMVPSTTWLKPVMVLMVDGGQDENPRFYGSVMTNALVFMRLRLEGFVIFTRAAGFSCYNAVERAQCFLTCILDGCRFESDHYGKVALDDQGVPKTAADSATERANHNHAVAECVSVLNSGEAFGRPVSYICTRAHTHT